MNQWNRRISERKKYIIFEMAEFKIRRNYIRKQNKVRRIVNDENNKILDNKCTEINMYIEGKRSTEIYKFIKNTII